MEVINEQGSLGGEVQHPQLTQRYFKTLDGLTDYIRVFKVTNGAFAYGDYPDVGLCYVLEYPWRVQE